MQEKKRRTRCIVYSRIVGYLSPLREWNKGKKAEFKDRQVFDVDLDKNVNPDTNINKAYKTNC